MKARWFLLVACLAVASCTDDSTPLPAPSEVSTTTQPPVTEPPTLEEVLRLEPGDLEGEWYFLDEVRRGVGPCFEFDPAPVTLVPEHGFRERISIDEGSSAVEAGRRVIERRSVTTRSIVFQEEADARSAFSAISECDEPSDPYDPPATIEAVDVGDEAVLIHTDALAAAVIARFGRALTIILTVHPNNPPDVALTLAVARMLEARVAALD